MFSSPRGVAVIGASRTPGKLGHDVLHNVIRYGYPGAVYPIHPEADEILGLPCYASVLDVPGPVDLAVVAIPSRRVARSLAECGEKGVQGAIVLSAGFREVGAEGRQRERELVDIARRYGMRLIGPNSLGIIDTTCNLNASFAVGMPRAGTIAFVSQSGALCTAILDMALADNVGFSRFVSLGNKADADEVAFIQAWGNDAHTRVILAYVEGIEAGPEFLRVARQVSNEKPILIIKSGTTGAGSRAVSWHTGTLAGSEQAYEAAFRQGGVIRARSVEDLFDYGVAFARQPLPANDRIAIITNAGGPGIMAADACDLAGLQLAALEADTLAVLREALPAAASALNPVDLLGDALADRYGLALRALLADPNVGGIVVILTPQAATQVEETARLVGELARGSAKPVLASFMGAGTVAPGIRLLQQYGVPNYPVPERAVAALAAMARHRRWRERPPLALEAFAVDRERVRRILARARAEGRLGLGDVAGRDILAAYGLRTPRTRLARSADEAARLAAEIGLPVALKVAAPDILHKTEVGGVQLHLSDPVQVREAFGLLVYRADQSLPGVEIWGCLVQEMVQGGKEVIVGMKRDPHFGPLLTFRLGGVYVEALRDVASRIAPFDRRDAQEMIREIRSFNLLRGVPGEPPADLEALVEALLRLSQLATDFPEITEFEITPLVVLAGGRGVIGVDMRLILHAWTLDKSDQTLPQADKPLEIG